MPAAPRLVPTCSHWGNYLVETRDGRLAAIHPYADDREPTPIGQSLLQSLDPGCRIAAPMVRRGWLARREASDGAGRGREPFVEVSWDEALDLAAAALARVRAEHGNEAIYGGSYGWSSAGRFHHAQSQVHRFLNAIGGYVASRTSYSVGAAEVVVPRVLGLDFLDLMYEAPTVEDMVAHTGLVVAFGGIALKNSQVMNGGLGAHSARGQLDRFARAGIEFVNVSPVRDDVGEALGAAWWPCRPGSDVAVMLALAHVLLVEGLHDRAFLDRYCVGFERFAPYLLGESDGQPKDPEWAEGISEIPAADVRALARRMAATRTVIGVSWSLQRAEHGEQGYWMATVLGAMLGTHGLPGGGVAYGYGSVHNIGFAGRRFPPFRVGALPQGENPVAAFIPVARIADALLAPGTEIDYDGARVRLPHLRLVYWAGGNPFHHHQDLNRLRRAWARPETIIVNEPFWTAAARHADIVFPCTTPLERDDLGASPYECTISPMRKAVERYAGSRDDYDVFTELAARLDVEGAFTEGLDAAGWVRRLYATTRENAARAGIELPDFESFWTGEQIRIADRVPDRAFRLERFRRDPDGDALPTPSGRIEIFSETVDAFGYDDCRGHPAWYDKVEFLGAERARRFPLHLISNQPRTRLHSQYDHGVTSRSAKIRDREPVRMNPADARARGIAAGDVVRVFNDRGSCLAGAVLTDALRPGVIELATGAWYDPEDPRLDDPLDVHGNPNVLTRDAPTSRLAQAPTAHSCLVEVEPFAGEPPPVKAFRPPPIEGRG